MSGCSRQPPPNSVGREHASLANKDLEQMYSDLSTIVLLKEDIEEPIVVYPLYD